MGINLVNRHKSQGHWSESIVARALTVNAQKKNEKKHTRNKLTKKYEIFIISDQISIHIYRSKPSQNPDEFHSK